MLTLRDVREGSGCKKWKTENDIQTESKRGRERDWMCGNPLDYIKNYLRPYSMLVIQFQRQLFRCACRILMMEQKAARNNNNRHRISSRAFAFLHTMVDVIDFFSRYFSSQRKGENEIENSYLSFDRYLWAQELYVWEWMPRMYMYRHKPQMRSISLSSFAALP